MNTATKLLVAMRRNALDWQIAQLQTVAKQHGIDWRHGGGSHCVFVRKDGKTLPVPAHRPIKPIYCEEVHRPRGWSMKHEQVNRLPI